jgi:hypothetical protein
LHQSGLFTIIGEARWTVRAPRRVFFATLGHPRRRDILIGVAGSRGLAAWLVHTINTVIDGAPTPAHRPPGEFVRTGYFGIGFDDLVSKRWSCIAWSVTGADGNPDPLVGRVGVSAISSPDQERAERLALTLNALLGDSAFALAAIDIARNETPTLLDGWPAPS